MSGEKFLNPEEIRQMLQGRYGPGIQVEVVPGPQTEGSKEDDQAASRQKAYRFDYRPSEIKAFLDRFVIRQDDAKKVLATAVCDHYHHIQRCRSADDCRDYKKQNILLIGPTGVGKTYLIQNIARLIGVPFVKADATKYSETGYVGGDVDDLIRELVQQADGDVELAQFGIVYLDEVDKIAGPANMVGRDVSGHGVQRGLLKLMEETEVPLRAPNDVASQMQAFMDFQTKGKVEKKSINTKHILFIVSGAFNGLTEIIRKRIGAKQIGFLADKSGAERDDFLLTQVRSTDFIEYGFEAEFIGRLPVTVHVNPLTADDLFEILKFSEGSLLKQYKSDFSAYGIDAYFTDDGMRALAELASTEQTGARGLVTVCEKTLRNFKYELPDYPAVRELVVTRELVESPEKVLHELGENPNMFRDRVLAFRLDRFREEFAAEQGFEFVLTDTARARLQKIAETSQTDPVEFCRSLFSGFEHGLQLLRQAPVKGSYELTELGLEKPGEALEEWIRQTYR